jgi:hypothetical protein
MVGDMPQAFISYVSENRAEVEKLADALRKLGCEVWLDKNEISPGANWKIALQKAIEEGNYFIACFSDAYFARTKSFMNDELNIAIDEIRQRPDDAVFFIPIKLDRCDVPYFLIRSGKTLKDYQFVELYKDWDKGVRNIARVVNEEDKKK